MLDLLGSLGRFVDGHLLIAPYVGVHGYFGREAQKARALRRALFPARGRPPRVGVFVDDLGSIHGVATMYANVGRVAARRAGPVGVAGTEAGRLRLVTCGAAGATVDGVAGGAAAPPEEGAGPVTLRPIATLPLPLYGGKALPVPSLLDLLDHIAAARYDVLHVATPGPLGVEALIAGAVLGLPVVGAYHTEFGTYARALSGDAMVGDLVELAVREFYERCAVVAVPSAATAVALRERGYGVDPERFAVFTNGVDTALFDPARRSARRRAELGAGAGAGKTLLLYAGRVSREKGLEGLAEGYLALRARRGDVHLVVAGDGPYRAELEARLGPTATFTGFLRGEALAATYAACDLFAFPSLTDTLGRAVAEAQAAGLPAVVFGAGGPRECLVPGESGLVAEAGDGAAFFARIEELVDDPERRARMGAAARAFAAGLTWERVYDDLLALYRRVAGEPAAAAPDWPLAGPSVDPSAGAAAGVAAATA